MALSIEPLALESKLQPGDILLYRGTGLYGWVIRLKTWHAEGHCEGYIGDGKSVASRDGKGVAIYSLRTKDLMYVLRPKLPFQFRAAMDWFYHHANGRPYGWLDLLNFIGLNVQTKGVICSTFLTDWERAGAVPLFNGEPSRLVAPFEFVLDELLTPVDVGV